MTARADDARRLFCDPDRREIAEWSIEGRGVIMHLLVEQSQLIEFEDREDREVPRGDLLDLMKLLHALLRIVLDLHLLEKLVHPRARIMRGIGEGHALD